MLTRLALILFSVIVAWPMARPGLAGEDEDDFHLSEADRYYLFDFEPRYRISDCIVRLDISIKAPSEDYPTHKLVVAFTRYLREREPRAAGYDYRFLPGLRSVYLIYRDDCDRRFEITEAMVAAATSSYPEFEIDVRPERYERDPDVMADLDASWIDSPGYDPRNWERKKAMVHGDVEMMLSLARRADPEFGEDDDAVAAYILYFVALNRLPSRSDQEYLLQRMQAMLERVPEYRRREVQAVARKWHLGIKKYGESKSTE